VTALTFRPLDVAADFRLVNRWMQLPHVAPWWELAGPCAVVGAYLERQGALPYLDLWIVEDAAGAPFAYVETYRVADDALADCYDAQPGDRGFHLLIGPPERLGSGLGRELVRATVARLLADPGATRVVCEPDAGNARMLACCRGLGGEELATIEQPGRRAVLLGWTRVPVAAAA
jgi:RimJ/RimL family protein N-acetyltransferase